MAVNLSPYGGVGAQFLDNSGNVLTGGKIYTYAAGTTTPQATYTNATGAIAHSNPIILDAAGRVPGGEIWLTDGLQYKFVLKDSNDVLIATYDNIIGINSNFVNYDVQEEVQNATAGQTVFTLTTITYTPGTNTLSVYVDGVRQYVGLAYAETDSTTVTFVSGLHVGAEVQFTTAVTLSAGTTSADLVSYTPPYTGGNSTTVEDKLAQTVSLKDFGAVGDGVSDDSAAINNALNSGALVIDGSGYSYKIDSSVTISADTTLQNLKLIAGTAGMNMVLVNDKSSLINAILVGTGTTSVIERGVYPATDGASDVNLLNIDISNLTVGVHSQPLATITGERWTITGYIHDIVGTAGAFEGYGVLLSPANNCTVNAKLKTIARHAVYLSAGASYNNVDVNVDTCNYSAVSIYATGAQSPCQYNKIRGSFNNINQPAPQINGSAVDMAQKANYNDVSVRVVGSGNHGYGILIEGSSGGPYPTGNHIHDCEFTGSFLLSTIQSQNADNTTIVDNYINAIWTTAAINLGVSGVAPVSYAGYVEDNFIYAVDPTVNGIINSYEVPYHVGNNKVVNLTTGYSFNDYSIAKLRTGRLQTITGQVITGSISAGATADTVVTLPQSVSVTNRVILAQIIGGSAGTYTYANQIYAFNTSATQVTLRVFNGGGVAQTFNIMWQVIGD